MNHKRVRTDDFKTTTSTLRVTGRQNYETSSDIWVTRDIETEFEQKVDDRENVGWNVLRGPSAAYTIPHDYTQANLNGIVKVNLASGGINNTMENLRIRPVGCRNAYDAYPQTQQKLLPYLIPFRQYIRQNPYEIKSRELTFDVKSEKSPMPAQHWWDPTVNGDFVFSTHDNATVAGDANSFDAVGFCPRNLIQFGTFSAAPGNPNGLFVPFDAANPHLIKVNYQIDEDRLHFNNDNTVIVRVLPEVLGGGAGANHHFFQLDPTEAAERVNDRWSMRFDENGIAGRVVNHGITVPAHPANVNAPIAPLALPGDPAFDPAAWIQYSIDQEVYATFLTALQAYTAAVDKVNQATPWYGLKNFADFPNNNQSYQYVNGTLNELYELHLFSAAEPGKFVAGGLPVPNTFGPGGNVAPNFRLFLRRPLFSKGNAYNWDAHPGLARFYRWYNKEISITNPVANIFDRYLRPTPFRDLARTHAKKTRVQLGTWGVTWMGLLLGGNLPNTHRQINQFVIDIEDAALWAVLQALPATEESCLLLETGPVVLKTAGNQHQAPVVFGEDQTRFYLRFKTQHAVFAQAAGRNTITFGYNAIANVGGAQNFGNGVPQTLGDGDRLYPDQVLPLTGWIEPDAPGQSLIASRTAEGTPPALWVNAATEMVHIWANGRRPLMDTLANIAANSFHLHQKPNPADNDTVVDNTQPWLALNNMFQGNVYTNVPELVDYRTVKAGRSKTLITLKEPLFGLDSGMSSYRVNHIFKPRQWYNILLQDFDFTFNFAKFKNADVALTDLTLTAERDVVVGNDVERQVVDSKVDGTLRMDYTQTTAVTIRSRDGLDQRTKLLENITERYPLFNKYVLEVAGTENPEARISIYTERSVPDYLFIFAERNMPTHIPYIPDGNPIVVGLEIYGRTNKNRRLVSYLKDKHEIWQATLRNAHIFTNYDTLHEIGGVLISKEDLGTLERDEFSTQDNFDYDMKVFLENEAGGTISQKRSRDYMSITVHICCIYLDKLLLKGSGTNLSFVEA